MNNLRNEIVEKTNIINDKVNSVFNYIVNEFSYNFSNFVKFMSKQDIINVAIGLIIASQLTNLSILLTDQFFTPIINKITGQDKKLSDYKVTIFTIEFKVGLIIMNIINILLLILFLYIIYTLSKDGIEILLEDFSKIIKS
jgi:large-conductance mechanosensitive channel